MLLMDVRQVKKDGSDYALSVPLSILPGLNADSTISNPRNQGRALWRHGALYVCERLTSGVILNKIANGRSDIRYFIYTNKLRKRTLMPILG